MGCKSTENFRISKLKKNYCVVIPALVPTGPIRGAIAFANAIAHQRRVKIVALKQGNGWTPSINKAVEIICLDGKHFCSFANWKKYRDILLAFGGRNNVLSLSMCFSADFLNLFCRKYAQIFSSVRGNLPMNYKFEYGAIGLLLAKFHLLMLKKFDFVSVMTLSMAEQIKNISYNNPLIIGNFIDENDIERFRNKLPKNNFFTFIYVGSLTHRKQPILLIETIKILSDEGLNVNLNLVGSGDLKNQVLHLINKYKLNSKIKLHGHLDYPYSMVSKSDAFILPSFSEGVSRALLEALHLGVPSIVRNVDGSNEVIKPGYNGEYFSNKEELLAVMRNFIGGRYPRSNQSLLPENCRQMKEAFKLVSHVEY